MEFEWLDLLKLVAAVGAGAAIGIERELAAKPAGLRTNILICLGAALFTILSAKIAGEQMSAGGQFADRGRIAAQIVTGVGFLGAGAIIHLRRYVVGLTTAATIWAVASFGMAFGAGAFGLGTLGVVLACSILYGMGAVEWWLAKWRTIARFEIEMPLDTDMAEIVEELAGNAHVTWRSWSINKRPEGLVGRFKAVGPIRNLRTFQRGLLREEAITAVKRL